jgi:hypothetical protein
MTLAGCYSREIHEEKLLHASRPGSVGAEEAFLKGFMGVY